MDEAFLKTDCARMELEDFLTLWQMMGIYNLEIVFEDGEIHHISDPVEICWNHNNVTECFNPTDSHFNPDKILIRLEE